MSSVAVASKKRKIGDEIPTTDTKFLRQLLPESLAERIARDGQEKMLYVLGPRLYTTNMIGTIAWILTTEHRKLLDGKHLDTTITCQGRELKACGVILAARCKFFDSCLRAPFKYDLGS